MVLLNAVMVIAQVMRLLKHAQKTVYLQVNAQMVKLQIVQMMIVVQNHG